MNYNTKLDLIKDKQIIIGIDIAKHKHYASILSKETGKVITTNIKISNKKKSFEMFTKELNKWKKEKVIIGMEPTGHYWKVINNWLTQNGYKTVLVNPYHVKLSKELYNNINNKNDIKDSILISRIIRNGDFLNVLTIEKTYDELKQLSLVRDILIKNLSREKIRLRALLDEYIPEYCDCFKDPSLITSISFLEAFSLNGITKNKQFVKKINLIKKISRNAINKKKAKLIVEALSNGVGIKSGMYGAEYRLKLIIDQTKFFKKKIAEVEVKLKFYLDQTDEAKYMLSMVGIGTVTLSAFLGQTGRLGKFSNSKQMQKFAGMTPVQNKSGKFEGKTRLSKRGNNKMRSVIYKIAVSLISNNSEMRYLYKEKINSSKKKKLVALTSIASKALRILFKLGRNKIFYNASFIKKNIAVT